MSWILVQIVIALGSLFYSYVYFQKNGWRTNFMTTIKDNFKLIFYGLFPQLVAYGSVILGIFYLIFEDIYSQLHLSLFLYIPIAYIGYNLINMFLYFSGENRSVKRMFANERYLKEWLEKFGVTNKRDFYIQIDRHSKKPKGSLMASAPKEAIEQMKENKHEIPEGIYTRFRTMSKAEYEWNQKVRNWIKENEKSNIIRIEDHTFYNKDVAKYQGEIHIITEPTYFDIIEEKAKELPTNIKVIMSKERSLVHSLEWLIKNESKYLDENYKGTFKILQTI